MKKSHESGLATHIGSESCGAARKGGVEALTGERAGWVFSRAGPADLPYELDPIGRRHADIQKNGMKLLGS